MPPLAGDRGSVSSLAHLATSAPTPYVRPTLVEGKGDIVITGARHPVMEFQDGMSFIANDYRLVQRCV
jgi:DNA mismatch repair protein MSH2